MILLRRVILLLTAFGLQVTAQQLGLSVTARIGTTEFPLSDGQSVSFTSVRGPVTGVFTLRHLNPAPVTITQVAVTGQGFSIVSAPSTGSSFSIVDSASVTIRYSPVAGSSSSGQLTVAVSSGNSSRTFTFGLTGTSVSYSLIRGDGQRTALLPSGLIVFQATALGSAQTIRLVLSNDGAVNVPVTSVSLTGDFTPGSAVPTVIPAGSDIILPVMFRPRVRGLNAGSIDFVIAGTSVSFSLEGTGTAPVFSAAYALQTDGNARPLADGASVVYAPTGAGATASAEIVIINQGNGVGSVRSVSLSGAQFRLAGLPLLPAALEAGQLLRFNVVFAPTNLGQFSGALRIELEDRVINATLGGVTAAPDFLLSYIDPVTRNIVSLGPGAGLNFSRTLVGTSTSLTLVLRNAGAGTGFVSGIRSSGEEIRVIDLPTLPASIQPGAELRFGVRFDPVRRGTFSGTLTIALPEETRIVLVSGQAAAPNLTFEVSGGEAEPAPLAHEGELPVSVAVGETATRTISFGNAGDAPADVTSISVSGSGFQIVSAPFLPLTLEPGHFRTLTLTFTAATADTVRGRLRIAGTEFALIGTGLGPRLEFSYSNQAGTVRLGQNDTLLFPSARVGTQVRSDVEIVNSGTTPALLTSIESTVAGSVFTLENGPPLPMTLAVGGKLGFSLIFRPNSLGLISGGIRVNTQLVNVAGVGRDPVALPPVTLEGPVGTHEPARQPAYSLSLEQPYLMPVQGELELTFLSDVFRSNPAVQFSTGGRSARFTIPAGSRQALFENGSETVRLQTGTVAGTIVLQPAFATSAGLALQPESPVTLSLKIDRLAPKITAVELLSRTNSTIVLSVAGYSTTRSLESLTYEITGRDGYAFSNATVRLNVGPTAQSYFQSAQSEATGGAFSITVPVNLARGDSTSDLTQHIQSIKVTISNEIGSSEFIFNL